MSFLITGKPSFNSSTQTGYVSTIRTSSSVSEVLANVTNGRRTFIFIHYHGSRELALYHYPSRKAVVRSAP